MLKVLVAFLLVVAIRSFEIGDRIDKKSDFVLCRNCGIKILTTDSIISKVSPVSVQSFNDTIFNSDEILVQVFSKDIFFEIPVITSKHSSCVGIGEILTEATNFNCINEFQWEYDDTWFPGYQWKACVCSECGAFVGYRNPHHIPQKPELKMANTTLSQKDQDFLAECEEEFKDRYTENDEEFMKVHSLEPSKPPILENWWVPNNSGRRNDRRNNRRNHPYERRDNRGRDYQDRRDNYDSRGYNDYSGFEGNRQRRRYY